MYQVTVARVFAAAHALRLYDGSTEPVHGHNWTVEVTVAAEQLDEIDVVVDFHQLETVIDRLLERVNNTNLNDIEPFLDGAINPTAERVAWWISREVGEALPHGARLDSVKVGEAPGCSATYRPSRRKRGD